jgi:polar amino acid transport system permease protein
MHPALETLAANAPLFVDGILVTLGIAAASTAASFLAGTALGVLRASSTNGVVLALARVWLEAFRVIPILVWLFIVFFALPTALDINIPGVFAAILVFSLWGAAEMGEITRGGLTTIPRAQYDAGRALGFGETQIYLRIIIPQAARRTLPGAVNLATRIIKTTSLATFVGVTDIVKRGQQIIERTGASFAVYAFLLFVFFALCFPLSLLARRMERRLD